MPPSSRTTLNERAYFEHNDVWQPYNAACMWAISLLKSCTQPIADVLVVYPWQVQMISIEFGCPSSGNECTDLNPSRPGTHKSRVGKHAMITWAYRVTHTFIASLNNFNTMPVYQDVIETVHGPDTLGPP